MSYSGIMLNWFYLWIFVNNNQCFGGSYSRFMNQHEWLRSGTHSELYVICKVSSMHPHFWCKYFSLELFCLYNIRIVRPFWLIMLYSLEGLNIKTNIMTLLQFTQTLQITIHLCHCHFFQTLTINNF